MCAGQRKETTDFSRVSEEIGIDLPTTLELLNLLFLQTRKTNASLKSAAENGDYPNVVAYAHDIKGSCGNFRLMDLYETAAAVEKMGRSGGPAGGMLPLVAEIDRMLDLYAEEMDKDHGAIESGTD